jgi:hypothetical protein
MDREDSVVASRDQDARPQTEANASAQPSVVAPSVRFGDLIVNGWASESNPTRVGYFVREGRRTGRMNPGRYFEVTDGNGKFWELPLDSDHKISVREAVSAEMQGAEAEIKRLKAALKPFADLGVGSGPDDEWDAAPYRITRGAIRQARRALDGSQHAGEPRGDAQRRATPDLPLGDA